RRLGLALAEDWLRDQRWGGWSGSNQFASRPAGVNICSSLHYWELRRIFADVPISPDDVLVDFGCGGGRLINFWLSMGLENKMIGLEIEPTLAERTTRRLAGRKNVEIIAGDGLQHLPPDATFYWLFNPFTNTPEGWRMMVELSSLLKDRPVRLLVHR